MLFIIIYMLLTLTLILLPMFSRYWLQTSWVPGARLQRGTQVHHLSEWQIHHCGLQYQAAVLRQGIPQSRVTFQSFEQLIKQTWVINYLLMHIERHESIKVPYPVHFWLKE